MENSNIEIDWRSRMLIDLERLYEEKGQVPSVTDINKEGSFTGDEYIEEFGSICNAFEEADIPYRRHGIETDELLRAIERLKEKLGGVPTRSDMAQFGDYSGIVYDFRFGSFEAALNELDYELPDERAADYNLRSVQRGNRVIDSLCEKFEVSDTVGERSKEVFLDAAKNDVLLGNSVTSVAGGSFVVGCYDNDVGVPSPIINEYLEVDNVTRQYRRLAHQLSLMVLPPDASRYVDTIASLVGISDGKTELVRTAVEEFIDDNPNHGKSPITIVSSAIYCLETCGNKDYSQIFIGDKSGVSEVSIRNNYDRFRPYFSEEEVTAVVNET